MKFEKFQNEDFSLDVLKPRTSSAPKKSTRSCKICLVFILFPTLLLCICFLRLTFTYEYETVFKNVRVQTEYDRSDLPSMLPSISLTLKNKNFKLEHRLVPSALTQSFNVSTIDFLMTSSGLNGEKSFLTMAFRILWAALETITKSFSFKFEFESKRSLKVKQGGEFEFGIKKLNTRESDVECFGVGVLNRLGKSRSTGETEVCFELGNSSWFGGHESLYQPYWPINTQQFEYVAYVTGRE